MLSRSLLAALLFGAPAAFAGDRVHAGNWEATMVTDGDPLFQHVEEGEDDMPAHIRTALTAVNLSIPVSAGASPR